MHKYLTLLLLAILTPLAFAEEPVKRPARDSYRPYIEAWGRFSDGEGIKIPEGIQGQYMRITVSPATLPDPLLKYRFNVMSTESENGSSAFLFSQALLEYRRVRNRKQEELLQSEEYKNYSPPKDSLIMQQMQFRAFPVYADWPTEFHVEITAEEEANLYYELAEVYNLLEKASKKTYFDWSDSYEFKGIGTLMPNLQDARELARYLGSKANWEIRNGNYDAAVKTIRIGFALGRQIRDSKPHNSLVVGLVGLAIQGIMLQQIHELQAQPDAPNLYPALTQLHFSMESLQFSMEAERLWVFPRPFAGDIFERIDTASEQECVTVLNDLLETLIVGSSDPNWDESNIESTRSMLSTLACLASYPYAKERLLSLGKTEEEIDALSTYQVVAPHVLGEIKKAYDLITVLSMLPPGQSHTAIDFNYEKYLDHSDPANIILAMLLPATQAAKEAYHRQPQTLDRIKIIEALRYYAAVHDGKLPQSLDDITELPVPKINPTDGKPYVYRVEGNTAILEYTGSGGLSRMETVVK